MRMGNNAIVLKKEPGIDCPEEGKYTSQVLENILVHGIKVEMGFDDYKQYDLNKYSLALSAVQIVVTIIVAALIYLGDDAPKHILGLLGLSIVICIILIIVLARTKQGLDKRNDYFKITPL